VNVLRATLTDRDGWSTGGRCPIEKTMALVGTKSAILVMREAYYGTTRFDDFVRRVGITAAPMSVRLAELVEGRLLEKRYYREPGQRGRNEYVPTAAGIDFMPVVMAMFQWGGKHFDGEDRPSRSAQRPDQGPAPGASQWLRVGYRQLGIPRGPSSTSVPGHRRSAGRGLPATSDRPTAPGKHDRGLSIDASGGHARLSFPADLVDAQGVGRVWHANNLKHLGPSFFTKFLYAADAEGTRPGRALILDQFVAVALKDADGWDISRTGPWEPATYERWLDHAHGIAAAEGVRPDAVEMAYFNHGRDKS
jgi:DNA-binding HxlR family transcriptional regulator